MWLRFQVNYLYTGLRECSSHCFHRLKCLGLSFICLVREVPAHLSPKSILRGLSVCQRIEHSDRISHISREPADGVKAYEELLLQLVATVVELV